MKKKQLTYDEAYEKLNQILNEVRMGEIPLEVLMQKIKEANDLVSFCKTALGVAEDELNRALTKM